MNSSHQTLNSVPLYLRSDGPESASPILLLHGGPGAHHDYLYPQFLELARDYRLITYDQRGGGRSRTDDPDPISWETHVADLAAVCREMGIEAPVLVGYSWGGLLAMLYAIACTENPDLPTPSCMVLVSPAPYKAEWRAEFEAELVRRQGSEAIGGARKLLAESGLRESDPEAYRQRVFELSVAGYFADPSKAVNLTPFRVTGKVQQSVWNSLGRYDLGQKLSSLQLPVLVIHGRQDPIPLHSAQSAAEILGAKFMALDNCGHVPYVERSEDLFTAIREFLNEQVND